MYPFFAMLIISAATWFCATASTAADTGSAPVYTNADLDSYRRSPDGTAPQKTAARTDQNKKSADAATKKEMKEKKSWCSKATALRKKIEDVQADIREAEKKAHQNSDASDTKKLANRKKIEKLQKKLAAAERDLKKLEDDAHRKGIPPGWLRCQFD